MKRSLPSCFTDSSNFFKKFNKKEDPAPPVTQYPLGAVSPHRPLLPLLPGLPYASEPIYVFRDGKRVEMGRKVLFLCFSNYYETYNFCTSWNDQGRGDFFQFVKTTWSNHPTKHYSGLWLDSNDTLSPYFFSVFKQSILDRGDFSLTSCFSFGNFFYKSHLAQPFYSRFGFMEVLTQSFMMDHFGFQDYPKDIFGVIKRFILMLDFAFYFQHFRFFLEHSLEASHSDHLKGLTVDSLKSQLLGGWSCPDHPMKVALHGPKGELFLV